MSQRSYYLLLCLLIGVSSFAQKTKSVSIGHEHFPVPPATDTRLFYIQRTPNTNTVVYEANLLANKMFNPKQPIKAYWLRYAEKGQKEDLSYIQQNIGYGFDATPIPNEPNSYEGWIVSYKKRKFKLTHDAKGLPIALFPINGKMQILQHIFVNIEETGHLIPKVLSVELWGKDLKTGIEVYERFKP
jgi:Domain of unknown function (DUF4833)